jgi:uncharacterized protein, PH0010 family
MDMELKDGSELVRFARYAIKSYLEGKSKEEILSETDKELDRFNRNSGVFVTLDTHPKKELRGCIGYPEPIYPLNRALVLSAISAATEDPRFPSLSKRELDSILVEVTVLTSPEKIEYKDPEDLVKKIQIGKDGLIAEKGIFRGLLLPQVPIEWKWNSEEFLSHTCQKAGLPTDEWKKGNVLFYKFQGEIFSEIGPDGKIEEH